MSADGDGGPVVKYTLQVADDIDIDVTPEGEEPQEPVFETRTVWVDAVSIEVPSRTKAPTAVRAACAKAGIEAKPGVQVRLLPAAVAEPIELLPPAPTPGPRQVRL